MNIAIAGYTGYIGRHVFKYLRDKGYEVQGIDRNILNDDQALKDILKNTDALCVFTGYPIIKRWNRKNKRKMLESRGGVNKRLTDIINRENIQIRTFIATSAMGIYDTDRFNHDNEGYSNKGFLTDVLRDCEDFKLKNDRIRKVILRLAVVLGKESGYFKNLQLAWKMGLTPAFNHGKANFCFIHIQDVARCVEHCLINENIADVVNVSAPEVNKEYVFHDLLPRKLKIFAPGFMARIVFGAASRVILSVPKVIPEKLIKNGFKFNFPTVREAIKDTLAD